MSIWYFLDTIFPDRQLLLLPGDVPKDRLNWPYKSEQLKKQPIYYEWEMMVARKGSFSNKVIHTAQKFKTSYFSALH